MPKSDWRDFVFGFGNPLFKKGRQRWSNLLYGTPEKRENVSLLRPEQEPLFTSAVNAGLAPGAGGAFGESADYYRNILNNDPEALQAFMAPELRRYGEEIAPGISEQYAGFGAGGLNSSSFRNAQIQGGVDLSERLGAIRANLRQAAAQGLTNIGQIGLQNYSQNMVTEPGTKGILPGLASAAVPVALAAAGGAIGGPPGAAAGYTAGQYINQPSGQSVPMPQYAAPVPYGGGNAMNTWGANKVGVNSSPYGTNQIKASPGIPGGGGGRFGLPNFMQRQ